MLRVCFNTVTSQINIILAPCTRLRSTWVSAKKYCKVGCSIGGYWLLQLFSIYLSKRSPCKCFRRKQQQTAIDTLCVTGMESKLLIRSFYYAKYLGSSFINTIFLSCPGPYFCGHVSINDTCTCFCIMFTNCLNSEVYRPLATSRGNNAQVGDL